jgi:hypothetical protein
VTRIFAFLFLALSLGCSRKDMSTPSSGSKPEPSSSAPAKPAPLTYSKARADATGSEGQRVVWRAKAVRYLEMEDPDRGQAARYYLLLAEDEAKKGQFPPASAVLVDAKDVRLEGGAAEAIRVGKAGTIIFQGGNVRWASMDCAPVVVTVRGTVKRSREFSSDLEGTGKDALVLSPAVIELAEDK